MGIIFAHGMFAGTHAGRSLGIDTLFETRLPPVSTSRARLFEAVRWTAEAHRAGERRTIRVAAEPKTSLPHPRRPL